MNDVSKRFSSNKIGSESTARQTVASWRTPTLVIGFGSLIALIAFGPRSTLGFFLTPLFIIPATWVMDRMGDRRRPESDA